jgi:signal transduction histidine kinase
VKSYHRQPERHRQTTLVGTDWGARLLGMLVVNGLMGISLTAVYISLLNILPLIHTSRNLAHALSTIAVAVAVMPLRPRFVALSNRLLQREWQDSQDLLREFTRSLSRTIDPGSLRELMVDDLPSRLRVRGAMIWMLEPPEDRIFRAIGATPGTSGIELLTQGVAPNQMRVTKGYLTIDAETDSVWAQPFISRGIHVLFPLRIGDRLIGMYGIGEPIGWKSYPPHVINILLTLVPALAGALENARAYTVIARLNEQLYELDKRKDEFIESVGHELRTPLTSLSLATQLLTTNPELANEMQGILVNNVNRLQGLIDRILSLEPQQPPPIGPTSAVTLAELLGEVLEVFAPTAQARGVRLAIDVAPELAVWGEPDRLRRAVHEIVDNAIRYGGDGMVQVVAELREGLVVISISDQGQGIPEDERHLLFSSFYRGRKTRALSVTPGVGLGLSIARREIEALGGQVWLECSGSAGTTIAMALPAVVELLPEKERAVGE